MMWEIGKINVVIVELLNFGGEFVVKKVVFRSVIKCWILEVFLIIEVNFYFDGVVCLCVIIV